MNIFDFSTNDILEIADKLMTFFKQVMQWLGIFVLPDEKPAEEGE